MNHIAKDLDDRPEVKIVEVGPRDGLQNESTAVPIEIRVELISRLVKSGLPAIEIGSFVAPKWVPQMQGTDLIASTLAHDLETDFIALVPNMQGMERALQAKMSQVAIFTAASETFCLKNTNCTLDESFERFKPIMQVAAAHDILVRGYVSCVMGCPYEGAVTPSQVIPVVERLFEIGCSEISLGDTIGVGTISSTRALIGSMVNHFDPAAIAVHFHDTYGQALPNILVALDKSITVVDSSVGGLGGCPYAKGASGNVATEDVVYMLDGLGVRTEVDVNALAETSRFIFSHLQRDPQSRVTQAKMAQQNES